MSDEIYTKKFEILNLYEAQWLWAITHITRVDFSTTMNAKFISYDLYAKNPNGENSVCFSIEIWLLDLSLDILVVQNFIFWYFEKFYPDIHVNWGK